MKKILSIVTLLVLMVPVIWGQDNVTDIDGNEYQAVQIGDQLFAQMVDAFDGWSGTLGGDKVEVYIYTDKKMIKHSLFKSWVSTDAWKEYCTKDNVALISEGKNACKLLKKLK